jgi:hypothetical protein
MNLKIKRQNRPSKYVDCGVYQHSPSVQKIMSYKPKKSFDQNCNHNSKFAQRLFRERAPNRNY